MKATNDDGIPYPQPQPGPATVPDLGGDDDDPYC